MDGSLLSRLMNSRDSVKQQLETRRKQDATLDDDRKVAREISRGLYDKAKKGRKVCLCSYS